MSTGEVAEGPPGASVAASLAGRDRILGVIAGVMLLAAVWLLAFGGPGDGGAAVTGPPPDLSLVAPANGSVVEAPLLLRFRTGEARLLSGPSGWGTGGYHLHLSLNGVELMPAPGDIRHVEDAWVWTVPNAPVGEMTLRLLWSDEAHRPVEAGASSEVTVTVR